MNNHICPDCGTDNESGYVYCKNCGTPLKTEEVHTPPVQQYAPAPDHAPEPNYGNTSGSNYQDCRGDGIGGIPQEEIALFVGRKANEICPKFLKMELTRSKVSWCWPVAILSFFFGPMGAALWFFYRKMYKHAACLSAIGAVITVITSVLTIGSAAGLEEFLNLYMNGDFEGAISSLQTTETVFTLIAGLINNIVTIATLVLCGIFGFHWYKIHCINKIRSFRSVLADQRYYKFGIASVGGVSGGMLALGIVIMLCVNYATSFITTLISMIA